MKYFKMIAVIMALLLSSLGLSGCVGYQAFPLAARSGDTIALALGSSPKHETSPGSQITLNDLDVTIQQNGTSYPVKKRYLFRLYTDLTCSASNFGIYTEPVGEWSLVLDLVDPNTNAPLELTAGQQAEVVVNTDKLQQIWGTGEGSLSSTPVYILPGTGQSHNFNNNAWSDIANLQPLPQLEISFSGSGKAAAVDLDIDYDETVLSTASTIKIRQDISKPNIILNQRVYSDNGNQKMRIMLMTNQGGVPANTMKCFVVWDPSMTSGLVTADSFTVTPKFYNTSGAPMTGISVVKTLLYQ